MGYLESKRQHFGYCVVVAGEGNVMVYLKQPMQDDRMSTPFERELLNELDVERYELTGLSAQ